MEPPPGIHQLKAEEVFGEADALGGLALAGGSREEHEALGEGFVGLKNGLPEVGGVAAGADVGEFRAEAGPEPFDDMAGCATGLAVNLLPGYGVTRDGLWRDRA